MSSLLEVRNISAGYGKTTVITDVSFTCLPGKLIALVGPNGAGKSTLLKVMAGMVVPQTGSLFFKEREIGVMADRERARSISSLFAFPPWVVPMTVEEFVALGRFPHREKTVRENRRAVNTALERCSIGHLRNRSIVNLSQGERQLAHLAAVLAQDTPFMVLDEPAAHLDLHHVSLILGIIGDLAREGKTIMVALHDLNHALMACHEVVVMAGGRIVAQGEPRDVLNGKFLGELYGTGARVMMSSEGPIILPNLEK